MRVCIYDCVVFDYKQEQRSTVITLFKGGSLVVVLVMKRFCLYSLDMNKHVLHFFLDVVPQKCHGSVKR